MWCIARARPEDAPNIVELSEQLAFATLSAESREAIGFLVSGYGADVYRSWACRSRSFLIARESGTLAGFLLSYPFCLADPGDGFARAVRTEHLPTWRDHQITIIKQIAVGPAYARQGIARHLYLRLFHMLPRDSCVFGAIVEEPRNPASEGFHAALNFRRIGSRGAEDGRLRGIWFRRVDERK